MPRAADLYRRLLKLYPARFREEYGTPLARQFADEYRDAGGGWPRLVLWTRLGGDLLISIPRERARELRQDVRYALRIYARRPLVTLLAFAALTLAIGATTGVFSVVNALLLRSLPFRSPERLVRVEGYRPRTTTTSVGFHEWRTASSFLEDAAIYDSAEMTLSRQPGAIRVKVSETSSNFFAVLGAQPTIGRTFAAREDAAGGNAIAVISDGLWRQSFAADVRAIGSTIHLNGVPLTVVGVASKGFDYPARTAIWTPTVFEDERLPKRDVTLWQIFGRLKPGLPLATANGLLEAEVARTEPESLKPAVIGHYGRIPPRLISLRDELAGPARHASLVLFGAVAFVLLVASANVANLLLTRVTERRRELAIRTALGASRARLLQQLITESLILTLGASAGGLVVARWASGLAAAAQPAQIMAQRYAVMDWPVVGFAVALAVVTGLLFGVLPAFVIVRLHPSDDVARAHSGIGGADSARLRGGLIAVQVALTLVLLAGGIAMARAFVTLVRTDLGFRTSGVVTMAVSLTGTPYGSTPAAAQYCRQALDRLRAMPGVESAAAVDGLPLAVKAWSGGSYAIEGGGQVRLAMVVGASEAYFHTLGAPILHGREFVEADARTAEPVAVVNEEFAATSGYGASIVGRRIQPVWGGKPQGKLRRVVGVARNLRDGGPAYQGTEQVFVPIDQRASGTVMLLAHVSGDATAQLPMCRDAVQSIDRQVGVFDVMTLDDRLAQTLTPPRFYTTVAVFFAAFALLLAIIGVYGVTSHSVVQRTHEIGVRMALGGSATSVRALLGRRTLVPVVVGIVVGAGATIALGRVLEHLIAPAQRIEPAACVAGGLAVAAVAFAAVWSATRRIVRLEPMRVLRAE